MLGSASGLAERHDLALQPHLHALERLLERVGFLADEICETRIRAQERQERRDALRWARNRPVDAFVGEQHGADNAVLRAHLSDARPEGGRVVDGDELVEGGNGPGHGALFEPAAGRRQAGRAGGGVALFGPRRRRRGAPLPGSPPSVSTPPGH